MQLTVVPPMIILHEINLNDNITCMKVRRYYMYIHTKVQNVTNENVLHIPLRDDVCFIVCTCCK